jgi:hypothetical protein
MFSAVDSGEQNKNKTDSSESVFNLFLVSFCVLFLLPKGSMVDYDFCLPLWFLFAYFFFSQRKSTVNL